MKNRFFISVVTSLILSNNVVNAKEISLQEAVDSIVKEYKVTYISKSNSLKDKKIDEKKINYKENALNSLNNILESNDLKAIEEDGVIYIIEKPKKTSNSKTTILEEISVNSGKNGSAEDGYLVENTKTLGVWGNLSLQDTPYSMSVLSSDFLENTITNNMGQIARQNPLLKNNDGISEAGELNANIRGFGILTALVDGIPLPNSSFGTSLKEVERVEVISGLSGFLYGSGNVGGVINYALKYPTKQPITNISVGNNGGKNYYTSVDTSQNITDNLSVRVFGNYQDGDTAIENYKDEEKLIGVSFAYKPTDNLDLGLYYSHLESVKGTKPFWLITGKRPSASIFDTSKSYTPDWTKVDGNSDKIELKANYNFRDNLRLRTAYIYKDDDRKRTIFYNYLNTNTGDLGRTLYWFYPQTTKNDGAYAYLDGDFNTGFVQHSLTFGGSFGREKAYSSGGHNTPWGASLGSNNLNDYNTWNYTIPSGTEDKDLDRKNFNTNFVLGDNITFSEQWSALLGVNYASMENKNGQGVTQYDKSELTPTVSLIYKPIENLTTYVTYMESLQNGDVIDNPIDTNDGKIFNPLKSKQYEIGAKYSINQDLLLSTALFRIEKANNMIEYFADNGNGKTQTTTQDGEQINQGVEMLLTGKPTDSLTLMGGFTYVSPKVEKTSDKTIEGKDAIDVAKVQAKMYAEYRLPISAKIFLNGGVYYTGTQWVDTANTEKLDAYTTLDFGARYETKLDGYDTTFRIYATNITDEKYWASTYYVGDPKNIAFNVTVKF